jgi:hypothetical protein
MAEITPDADIDSVIERLLEGIGDSHSARLSSRKTGPAY